MRISVGRRCFCFFFLLKHKNRENQTQPFAMPEPVRSQNQKLDESNTHVLRYAGVCIPISV